MPRAEFLWVESPGTSLDEAPRVGRTQFGDGYAQRGATGLNPIKQAWSIQLRDVDNVVGDQIIAFLRARLSPTGELESFDWTPLWSTTKISVTAPSWTRTASEVWGECNISIRFEQEFEVS